MKKHATLKPIFFLFLTVMLAFSSAKAFSATKPVKDYSYEIIPLLSPFNEYFFVKTDNPDPESFQFKDKSSKYYEYDSEYATICYDYDSWNEKPNLYPDVIYENKETARVSGGYIFRSNDTDGGTIVLQEKENPNNYYSDWKDTNVSFKLPVLKDEVDYLIDTYATKNDFWDNMDAVEAGFDSICKYSGSYILGTLYQSSKYWYLQYSPHADQIFYLVSPYSRKDNQVLFATYLYPFRYDSLGFPSMMAQVMARLNPDATYKWDSYSHYLIQVTYNGVTRSYGGAGNEEGQGIRENQILKYFKFSSGDQKLTLKDCSQLLTSYTELSVEDDVPRDGALTWSEICETVGEGSWVRMQGSRYAYLYKEDDGTIFFTDPADSTGSEIYWGGDLGYVSDAWIDGRYISYYEKFEKGHRFEDHPTSDIILLNENVPLITGNYNYTWNSEKESYEKEYSNVRVTETRANAFFQYSETEGVWTLYCNYEDNAFDYQSVCELVEQGLVSQSILDRMTLTVDEVKTMGVDKNANIEPNEYYVYDGRYKPGTFVPSHEHSFEGTVTKKATCSEEGEMTYICSVKGCERSYTEAIPKLAHSYKTTITKATLESNGKIVKKCKECAHVKSTTTIRHPKEFKLSKKTYVYDGESHKPTVKVFDTKGNQIDSSYYYTVKYDTGRKKVGTYSVKLSFKDRYKGSVTLSFRINPKPVALKSLTAGKSSLTVKWKKQTSQTTGYQIQYSTSSKFSSDKSKKVKISKNSTTSKKLANLASGKKYYVRIRTYKKVDETTYYSKWSEAKAAKSK